MSQESNVVSLDDYRALEDVVKIRTGAEAVMICAIIKGSFHTYIPTDISDIELVYLIQTLQDRRKMRVEQ